MENLTFRILQKGDLEMLDQLLHLYEDVFEYPDFTMPENSYLEGLLSRESMILMVALVDELVVGGLTAHILSSTSFTGNEVYIYDLAVAEDLQRKGVGGLLIQELKAHCRNRGDREIFVQADIVDQHAVDFYKKTGGELEEVVHFNYPL